MQLQNCLDSIVEWPAKWQMDITIKKCYIMKIGCFSSKFNRNTNGISLTYVISCKNLGVTIDTNLSFSTHCSQIKIKSNLSLYSLQYAEACNVGNTVIYSNTRCNIQWRAVGNIVFNLTGLRFEPQTCRYRDERVTAWSSGRCSLLCYLEKRHHKELIWFLQRFKYAILNCLLYIYTVLTHPCCKAMGIITEVIKYQCAIADIRHDKLDQH